MNKKIEQALNDQIAMEANAHFLYLSIASHYDVEGMEGVAAFFYEQSIEEGMHMMKILNYINESDGRAIVPQVNKPTAMFDDVLSTYELAYAHEKKVTDSINKIVELTVQEKDHGTYNFLQWFIAEQQEEESLMRGILDKIKLIGDGPQSNYFIDREIKEINANKEENPE